MFCAVYVLLKTSKPTKKSLNHNETYGFFEMLNRWLFNRFIHFYIASKMYHHIVLPKRLKYKKTLMLPYFMDELVLLVLELRFFVVVAFLLGGGVHCIVWHGFNGPISFYNGWQ